MNNLTRAKLIFIKNLVRAPWNVFPIRTDRLIVNKEVRARVRGNIRNDLIFSTANGVYLYLRAEKKVRQLVKGKYYGLVRGIGGWWVGRSNRNKDKPTSSTDISLLVMKDNKVKHVRPLLFGIPGEVHQIDIILGELIFPHTGYMQLLRVGAEKLFNSRWPLTVFDCEHVDLKLDSLAHVNSIYFYQNTIYLMAHNSTQHTGKPSQLISLEGGLARKKRLIETGAISAHNIFVDDRGDFLYCDSGRGILKKNLRAKFKTDKLVRGLSISVEKNVYVGGSEMTLDKARRFDSDATIYALDQKFKQIGQIDIPKGGNVYGVRQYNRPDLGMVSREGL